MKNADRVLFAVGDCIAGALVAVVTALGVRVVVAPGADMVGAMMAGMLIGTIVHLTIGMVLSLALGMFETMVPTMFVGMYGGMAFGMRDAMNPTPLATCLGVAGVFGVSVTLGVVFWNIQMRKHSEMELPDVARAQHDRLVAANPGREGGR